MFPGDPYGPGSPSGPGPTHSKGAAIHCEKWPSGGAGDEYSDLGRGNPRGHRRRPELTHGSLGKGVAHSSDHGPRTKPRRSQWREDSVMEQQGSQVSVDHGTLWLTVRQAAERAQCGVKLIDREVKVGRLRAVRVGGRRSPRFQILAAGRGVRRMQVVVS